MISGIFFVDFSVGPQNVGAGLAVIADGTINGGDASYLYRGQIDVHGNQARAVIEVAHYRGALNSVFGALQNFTLDLTGTVDVEKFIVHGKISNTPGPVISISGRKVAALYERKD
jgi:hypothetical protein